MKAALALLLLAACGTDFEPTPGGGDDDPQVSDGEAIYRERCMMCHGDTGAGSTKGPQILSPVIPYATYVTRTGRNDMGYPDPMPAFAGELSDAQIGAVLAWLAQAPKPTDGAGLYTRFCGNCHGADAYGGRVEQDLTSEIREEPEELREKVREGEGGNDYGDRTEYMPAWSAGALTDAEIALITSYIASLPPNPNGDGDDDDDD